MEEVVVDENPNLKTEAELKESETVVVDENLKLQADLEKDYGIFWDNESERREIFLKWMTHIKLYPADTDKCVHILLQKEKAQSIKLKQEENAKNMANKDAPSLLLSEVDQAEYFLNDPTRSLAAKIVNNIVRNDTNYFENIDVYFDRILSQIKQLGLETFTLLPYLKKRDGAPDELLPLFSFIDTLPHPVLDSWAASFLLTHFAKCALPTETAIQRVRYWLALNYTRITEKFSAESDQQKLAGNLLYSTETQSQLESRFKKEKDRITLKAYVLEVADINEIDIKGFAKEEANHIGDVLQILVEEKKYDFLDKLLPLVSKPTQIKLAADFIARNKFQLNDIIRQLMQQRKENGSTSELLDLLFLAQWEKIVENKKNKTSIETAISNAKKEYEASGREFDIADESITTRLKTAAVALPQFLPYLLWHYKNSDCYRDPSEIFGHIQNFLVKKKLVFGKKEEGDFENGYKKKSEKLFEEIDFSIIDSKKKNPNVFTATTQTRDPTSSHVGTNQDRAISGKLSAFELLTPEERETVVKATIQDAHGLFNKELKGGAVFNLCIVTGNNYIVANLGDSSAYKKSPTACTRINNLHNLRNPDEKSRTNPDWITENGWRIKHPTGEPGHHLGFTRGFGDLEYGERVGREPDIFKGELGDNEEIIIVTDGVTDFIDLKTYSENPGEPTENLAKNIVQHAVDKGSTDDITAVHIRRNGAVTGSIVAGVVDGHGKDGHKIAKDLKQKTLILLEAHTEETLRKKIEAEIARLEKYLSIDGVTNLILILKDQGLKRGDVLRKYKVAFAEQNMAERIEWVDLKRDLEDDYERYFYFPERQREIFEKWQKFFNENPRRLEDCNNILREKQATLIKGEADFAAPSQSLTFQLNAAAIVKTALENWNQLLNNDERSDFIARFKQANTENFNEILRRFILIEKESEHFLNKESFLNQLLVSHLNGPEIPQSKNDVYKLAIQKEKNSADFPQSDSLTNLFLLQELEYTADKHGFSHTQLLESLNNRDASYEFLFCCLWHLKNAEIAPDRVPDIITAFLKNNHIDLSLGNDELIKHLYGRVNPSIISNPGKATTQGGPHGKDLDKENLDGSKKFIINDNNKFETFKLRQKEIFLQNLFKKLQKTCGQYSFDASTANVYIRSGNTISAANVGNSYTVLVEIDDTQTPKKITTKCLSAAHNSKLEVNNRKRKISFSRAIGGRGYEGEGLSHEPYVSYTPEINMAGKHGFVILASGIEDEQFENSLSAKLQDFDFATPDIQNEIAKRLVKDAVDGGSKNNVTVIVDRLNAEEAKPIYSALFAGHDNFGRNVSRALEENFQEIVDAEITAEIDRQEKLSEALARLCERTKKYKEKLDEEIKEDITALDKRFPTNTQETKDILSNPAHFATYCQPTPYQQAVSDVLNKQKLLEEVNELATIADNNVEKNKDEEKLENFSKKLLDKPNPGQPTLSDRIEETRTGPLFIRGVKWVLSGLLVIAFPIGLPIHALIKLGTKKWLWESEGKKLENVTRKAQANLVPKTTMAAPGA